MAAPRRTCTALPQLFANVVPLTPDVAPEADPATMSEHHADHGDGERDGEGSPEMTTIDTALRDSLRALKLSGIQHTLEECNFAASPKLPAAQIRVSCRTRSPPGSIRPRIALIRIS